MDINNYSEKDIMQWTVIPELPKSWSSGFIVKHIAENLQYNVKTTNIYSYLCDCNDKINCIHIQCVLIYVSDSLDIAIANHTLYRLISFCEKIGINEQYFDNPLNDENYFENFDMNSIDSLIEFIETDTLKYIQHEFNFENPLPHIINLLHIDWKTYFITLNLLKKLSQKKYSDILDTTINQKKNMLQNSELQIVKKFYNDQLSLFQL